MKHTAKNILVGTIGAAGLFLASTATANADTTHTVAKNDTVWGLSQKYGVSIQSIEKLNNIDQNTHLIVTGQTLKVPASNSSTENTSSEENTSADTENTTDVTVQSGDTLWDLAQKYGTTVAKLRELNGLSADTTLIYPGKVLKVNGTAQATQSTTTATTTTADQTTAATTQDTTAQDTTAQQTTQETQTPQVTVSANHTTYTVQAGDSLYSIAQAYGVTVDSLRSANTLGATLAVGQTLTINDPTKDPSATQQATQDTTAQTQTTQQAAQDTTAQQTQQQATQNTTTTQSQQAAQSTTTTQSQQTQQAAQSTTTQSQQTQQAAQSTTTQSQQTQATQSTQQTTTTTTASSVSGSAIAAYAQTFIGVPYVWGGTTPSGFDCSGLTQYVYAHFGKQIGRTTIAQESAGTRIPVSQAQVGDLLFWGSAGSTYHVAIYLGGNSYIAAPEPGQSVKVGNMAYFMPSFAVHVN